jgi:predicted transcriptional regulator
MLALRLPPEIEARLAELAKRTGRTKSFYAREAILNHLDDWRISISPKTDLTICAKDAAGRFR